MRLSDVVTSADRRAALEADGSWTSETLVDRVLFHAEADADAIAVVDLEGTRSATYSQLVEDVWRLAHHLRELEVQPGDVVSVQLPNWYETVVVDLAVLAVGGVVNPMLPIYRERELRHMLGVGGVRVLFAPATYRRFDHAALAAELAGSLATLEHVITVADPRDEPDAFRRRLHGMPTDRPSVALDASDVTELIFTSGTEAAPKAIMHTEQTAGFGVRTAAQALELGQGDVVWMPSPIGHSTGLNYGVRMALHHGFPIVLQDAWSAAEAAALIEGHRCSYTIAATTFVSDLVEYATGHACDLSSLTRFGSGGAAVPPDVVEGAERQGATVLRMYGSTEALAVTWNRTGSPRARRLATDGQPLGGVEVETRSDGVAVRGEPGEIYVRSACTAAGFFADPERTEATWTSDGWVRSGDLGVLDDDGFLRIVGRKKEIIIRGGLNIAPREIEDVIVLHDDVVESAVVGYPDDRLGERACACIVLRPGRELELAGLVAFLREQGVAAFKLPERLLIVDALPKTPTGKVRKRDLVDLLA